MVMPSGKAMKWLLGPVVLAVVLAIVPALIEAKEFAALSEFAISENVSPVSRAALDPKDRFPATVGKLHATVLVTNAPAGTRVGAVLYLEGERVLPMEIEASDTRYINFTLTPPTDGWPAGRYEVRFSINGREQGRKAFVVQASAKDAARPSRASQAAPAAGPATESYRRRTIEGFGVSFEVPENWTGKVNDKRDVMIEGPAGTPAAELSVVFQFIDKAKAKGSSLAQQYGEALNLYRGIAGSKLVSEKSDMLLADRPARFFVMTFPAKDTRGRTVEFAHTQFVAELPRYYLWLHYQGPKPIYEANIGHFEHLLDSMRLNAK